MSGKHAAASLLCLALAACAPGIPSCAVGTPMRITTLYFGRDIPGRAPLTEAEWRQFQKQVITPALPDGYTVQDATGAWLDPQTHTTLAETTKIVIVAAPDTAASQAAIARIRAAYKAEFHQQSVGLTSTSGCGTFDE